MLTVTLNCLAPSQSLADFAGFYLAPVREIEDTIGQSVCEQCAPEDAGFWTIYGLDKDGMALAVHDADTPDEIVRVALQIALDHADKQWSYFDTTTGSSGPHASFQELADWLSWKIHDDLDDDEANDPLDARADAFENHPLADIREAFVTFSDYAGEGTTRNPYETLDLA